MIVKMLSSINLEKQTKKIFPSFQYIIIKSLKKDFYCITFVELRLVQNIYFRDIRLLHKYLLENLHL